MSVYIIAEIGINFNGSLENCLKMIDLSAQAGCHAAKFQFFTASGMYPKSAGKIDWKDGEKAYSYDIHEAVKRFELLPEWLDEIMARCIARNIDFMASVFDREGLEYLVQKGMNKIKLSSYTITNLPLIEAAAQTGLPIIMSTGGATLAETEEAVRCIQKVHNNIALLHCSIKYPTPLEEVNMGVLDTLKLAFPEVNIGYSDHTFEVSDAPVQAVYLGATVIEKHITLSKQMEGPDHFFALEPDELARMVIDINEARKRFLNGSGTVQPAIYGSTAKICYEHEKYLRDFAYMTLFAKRTIRKGDPIPPEAISILRPGKKQPGLPPKYLKLFSDHTITAKKEIACEDPITWDAILG
ncbi:N-acetylneuraminic acid synthase domain [Sulfuricurvum kujiense DSM 16994]|uniref:N-acetylneuraminic acid synthase domain n=1 Tax=Sulfuricurvum kujiense (strain ATCC BAA-921 / DSM 16994 / JCM 11577 / YK-1) TaxID=709032 RepID=E4TYA3_SULKY|nr:N-acetylneuraminate synthase family protein [Sulfuricurvum kujiense]ADR35048.1 N-acetylneuraminic acid synthase domain [Sulfuricurvum kujiense DSM 16994]